MRIPSTEFYLTGLTLDFQITSWLISGLHASSWPLMVLYVPVSTPNTDVDVVTNGSLVGQNCGREELVLRATLIPG